MVTMGRAEAVARQLFADEVSTGEDCRDEKGREGEPCSICAERWTIWRRRVIDVRVAMLAAF